MDRLLISFSGGRTSAYMTYRLLREHPAKEKLVVFANTGCEHEETLRFIDLCDLIDGFGTVWLEAAVSAERGEGTKARVANYVTASRDGRPFRDVIAKYGIPNPSYPHCTRELKERPIHAYLRNVGWGPGTYQTAVGIRADEVDRMQPEDGPRRFTYPLVKLGIRKEDVLAWWRRRPFNLDLPEHLGNCTWCWKKSLRKHLTLCRDFPEVYKFPRRMEEQYPFTGPGNFEGPRRFFRGNRTVDDIMLLSKQPFDAFVDPNFDVNEGCADSCEVFA